MTFETWMTCEVVASDGNYTIGYVDGKPAEWDGNMSDLQPGQEFIEKLHYQDFHDGNNLWRVLEDDWNIIDLDEDHCQ